LAYCGQALLFGLPLLAYGVLLYAADPFRLFPSSSFFSPALKERTAKPINPCLWKLIQFHHQPAPRILLGDSRMEGLYPELIREQVPLDYANLAYGGATMNEIIDSFWFAARRAPLHDVVIGINLNVYNGYAIYRRTEAAESFLTNRLLYFTNRNVTEAAYHGYRAAATGQVPKLDQVNESTDAFWRSVRDVQDLEYSRWAPPGAYRDKLREISQWCRQRGVKLTFVAFPSHQEIQQILVRRQRMADLENMKRDLAAFGTFVDFEIDAPLNRDRGKYLDPVHLNLEGRRQIIRRIWPDTPVRL